MFARDWRGVASAPASIIADPVRCVSNAAGAADDGSGVVAIVGKDKVGRLVDLSGLNDELDETFGGDLPEEHTFHEPSAVCLRQLREDPNKEPKEEVQELDLFAKAKGKYGSRAHLTAKMPERCCVSDAGHHACFLFERKNDNWIYKDTLGRMESGHEPYELCLPRGCAWDSDDQVYVADWGNNRIQVFDLPSYTSKEAEDYSTMSLAQLKRAARLSSRDFAGCVAKQDFIDVLEAPAYNEAFTLNTQEPYQRGYVVKHDDRSDEQKAEDEAIERERRKVEEAAAKEQEAKERARLQEIADYGEPGSSEEDSDEDSEDETTAGSPAKSKASPEKPAADRVEINRVDGVEGDATIRHTGHGPLAPQQAERRRCEAPACWVEEDGSVGARTM